MVDLTIHETNFFGSVYKDSVSYDDFDYFGNDLVYFDLQNIKCYVDTSYGIQGIELTYKYRNSQFQEFKSIDVKKNYSCVKQEFIFEPKEKITKIILFRSDDLKGFEITTNLARSFRFGLDRGETIILDEFCSGKNIVAGFFTKFDIRNGITGIGFYYVNRKEYSLFLSSGLFILRTKLKNQNFYNSIQQNNLGLEYEAIFRTCKLSKILFMGIMKYIINS